MSSFVHPLMRRYTLVRDITGLKHLEKGMVDEAIRSHRISYQVVFGTKATEYETGALHLTESYANPRELHQTAENALVARSRDCDSKLRGTYSLTVDQDQNVRTHINAAVQFLDDLAGRSMLLSACTQSEVDDFMAHRATYPTRTAHFVRWAVTHRHAHNLTAPASQWAGPSGPHDEDRRWEVARRLLHDDAAPTADRVAGLLLLLYAQHVNSIRHVTVDHIQHDGDKPKILLGTARSCCPRRSMP